jgi:hypothetical protein
MANTYITQDEFNKVWAPHGGHPGMLGLDATPGYVDPGDGSQAWKYTRYGGATGMKNPVYIKYANMVGGGFFDRPLPKKTTTPAAPNLSGGQATVPTVEQRMSRMGQAVQKGVNKGKINSKQLSKYQVPGQQPASPLVNRLSGPENDLAFNMPRNQYAGGAKTPVPMPNKLSTNELR